MVGIGNNMYVSYISIFVSYVVIDQVANFKVTGYGVDGRGEPEINFEKWLMFDRRGGFTLAYLDSRQTKKDWLLRHRTLAGPKLLDRNAKKEHDEDNDADSGSEKKIETSEIPSFRSDRRIIRLLISRHFADILQRVFLREQWTT
jgi:hypothetical protein